MPTGSYLFGWSRPKKIGNSSPLILQAVKRILERYSQEAADRVRTYAPVDSGLFQKSITAQPDFTNVLLWWIGSSLPYSAKLEYLWSIGMPTSRNKNSSASPHCISRGVNDIKNAFGEALQKAATGEWKKI